MAMRRYLPGVLLIGFTIMVGTVLSDGRMFIRWNNDADILQPTQKVYIHHDGSQERLVIQTKYEGPAEEMVWLVPVPAEPNVERGDPNLFEELSKETRTLDISLTDFLALDASSSTVGRNPVQWHKRVGDYDVVLLAPVGEEDVIEWLNTNDFGVPKEATPILSDYIAQQWWMIAARIHPDALTEITQESLAKGTLHPLDIAFPSTACVYPMRLTSLTDGPVEELIYIEGPTHYEPATLVDGDWDIRVFGGPIRTVPDEEVYSAVDHALEIRAGRTTTEIKRHLTKLRRVFEPEEMTNDLFFVPMSYETWMTRVDSNQIAQAATQFGRHRDLSGVPSLLAALSPEALEAAQEAEVTEIIRRPIPDGKPELRQALRSCIWALGEIATEHEMNDEVEPTLLLAAGHSYQLIRMEAYTALIKLDSRALGPVLLDQLARMSNSFPTILDSVWWEQGADMAAETDMAADWIQQFGTVQEKEVLSETLADWIADLPAELNGISILGWGNRVPYGAPGWVLWRTALTQDSSLLTPLQEYRSRLSEEETQKILPFLLTAEASCGSDEAVTWAANLLIEDQSKLEIRADGHAYLPSMGSGTSDFRLQQWALGRSMPRFPANWRLMPPRVCDIITRTALDRDRLSDWWILYLLGRLNTPQSQERDRLMELWDRNEGPLRIVVADLFYVWGHGDTLLQLYGQTDDADVQREITWALTELRIWERQQEG